MGVLSGIRGAERGYLLPLVIVSLVTRIGYYLYHLYFLGSLPVAYDTAWYLEHANAFLSGFEISMDVDGIFYLGYYSLLAVLLWVFRIYEAVVLFQMIVNALTVILVYKIALLLFNRRTAIVASVIYVLNYQVMYWSIFLITDSFFITLLLATVYFMIMAYKTAEPRYKYIFAASAAYMVFFRPTGIVTLTFIFAYIMINLNMKALKSFWTSRRLILLSSGFGILLVAAVLVIASGKLAPLFNSLDEYMTYLLKDYYVTGQIFDIQTPYDYQYEARVSVDYFNSFAISFFMNNWRDILILYSRRALSFFGLWVWKMDEAGLVMRLKYLVPFAAAMLLGLFGVISIFRNRIFKQASILFLVVLSIQFFCIFFFMDSAFRYRVPSLVFIGIIAAYGLDRLIAAGEKFINA